VRHHQVVALVAAVIFATPALAQMSCNAPNDGSVSCPDGSFGRRVGDSVYLSRPENDGGVTAPEPAPCYRDQDGSLICQ
jgi:hypothetical protein